MQHRKRFEFPGGLTARVTPVPIPNTEVKPCRADDTALETTRERRSPPGITLQRPQRLTAFAAFFYFPPAAIHYLETLVATFGRR